MKAYGGLARGEDLWLEPRQYEQAKTNSDFYIYMVENVRQGDPRLFTLRVLGGDHLRRLLLGAREQRYFTLPWGVGDYDSCPTGLDD